MSAGDGRRTAAELILLAADDLTIEGKKEFSEWELSVAAWTLSRNRFGMRGFEDAHPDHKRVMKEIMGKAPMNPVQRGYLERRRPNHYNLTTLGRSEAARLRAIDAPPGTETRSASDLYDNVAEYTGHRVFRAWLDDPAEPRTWLGASAFLQLAHHDPVELENRIRKVVRFASEGLEWCDHHGTSSLTRGPVGGARAIRRDELSKLQEFVGVLEDRFAAQVAAIRNKRGRTGGA